MSMTALNCLALGLGYSVLIAFLLIVLIGLVILGFAACDILCDFLFGRRKLKG